MDRKPVRLYHYNSNVFPITPLPLFPCPRCRQGNGGRRDTRVVVRQRCFNLQALPAQGASEDRSCARHCRKLLTASSQKTFETFSATMEFPSLLAWARGASSYTCTPEALVVKRTDNAEWVRYHGSAQRTGGRCSLEGSQWGRRAWNVHAINAPGILAHAHPAD